MSKLSERRATGLVTGNRSRLGRLFDDWLNKLIKQAENDKDAAFLCMYFYFRWLDESPNETKEPCEIHLTLWSRLYAAKQHNNTQATKELHQFIIDCNDSGIIIPEILRGFHPEDHIKRKKGRSYWDKVEINKGYTRKIYELRKQEGYLSCIDFEIWEILYYLNDILDLIAASDKGITNQLETIKEILNIPLSSQALQQLYLGDKTREIFSHRRLDIIKDLANYCFDYWKECYGWNT